MCSNSARVRPNGTFVIVKEAVAFHIAPAEELYKRGVYRDLPAYWNNVFSMGVEDNRERSILQWIKLCEANAGSKYSLSLHLLAAFERRGYRGRVCMSLQQLLFVNMG